MPDYYPVLKQPLAEAQPSHANASASTLSTGQYPSTSAPFPIAVPEYPPAHPSQGSAPVQYPEGAWHAAQHYGQDGQHAGSALWQGYGASEYPEGYCNPNGYPRNGSNGHLDTMQQQGYVYGNVSLPEILCSAFGWPSSPARSFFTAVRGRLIYQAALLLTLQVRMLLQRSEQSFVCDPATCKLKSPMISKAY